MAVLAGACCLCTLSQPAVAAGGAGGSGPSGTGGAAGTSNATGAGGTAGSSSVANSGTVGGGGGGGGGAGATGGAGGEGAASGASGAPGAGGSSPGASGQPGLNGGTSGAGGGGGGAHGAVSASLPTGNLTGGSGGSGGSSTGGGGGGGAGGYGAVLTGNGLTGTIGSVITGGNGGNGGNGGGLAGRFPGNGGDGGIGLVFTGTGNEVELLSSAAISGGNGGTPGSAVSPGSPGAGGAGITGQNLTLIVGGSVSGGLSGNGSTRANAVTFTGGTNRLELRSGYAFTGNVAGGGSDTLSLGGSTNGSFDSSVIGGQFTGFAVYDKRGSGTWTLTGTGSQDWTVQEGTLQVDGSTGAITAQSGGAATVNGTAGNITVQAGGLLGGIGTVGDVTVAGSGVHAPGNSIGTQTINGNYTNSGMLRIEASPSAADKLIVNGTVNITGAALDLVLSPATNASWSATNGPFVIIENNSGSAVTGTFSPITKNLLFLDETLDYAGGDGNDVTLLLSRNDVSLATVAQTPNQTATATAVEALGTGNPISDAIALSTDPDVVRANYDALSGEAHASAKTALIGSGHFLRAAMTDRLRSGFNGVASTSTALLAYSGDGLPDYAPTPTERFVIWGTAMGSWGSTKGDGNSARMDTSSGGFLGGADGRIENWRLGLMAGVSRTDFNSDVRQSSGDSDNYHIGVYAGSQWGGLALRTGVAYTWHAIDSARSVSIPGFTDHLEADYDARTIQAWGELGYRLDFSTIGVEPFANVAYVNFDADGFMERGGAAALTSSGQATDTTFTTLGARASTKLRTGALDATVRGSLGWQHAFGDTTPVSRVAFAGGSPFTISGVPIAEDAAVMEAGLDFNLSPTVVLGIAYGGQFGSDTSDQSVNVNLSIKF